MISKYREGKSRQLCNSFYVQKIRFEEGTRVGQIYSFDRRADITVNSFPFNLVLNSIHRATTLQASDTSESLADDWSRARIASIAFSACTWARSRHLFNPNSMKFLVHDIKMHTG